MASVATKDRNILPDFCYGCCLIENINLKTCGRCHLAKYCSEKCQKEDYPNHKKDCRKIKKLMDNVEGLAEELRCYSDFGQPAENYFETHVGRFWGFIETRDYCRARLELADELYRIGFEQGTKVFEIALAHYLELLRLNHSDNQGIRHKVPFLLLSLNRDEDAYNFIKWWETIDPEGNYDWGEPPASQEGEWMYLKSQDTQEDLLKIAKDVDCLPFLAALVLIKARIILKYETAKSEFDTFEEVLQSGSSSGQKLLCALPAMMKIKRYLGSNDAILHEQKEQLEKYLDIIQKNNPFFLKAVVNPGLMMNMKPPEYIEIGTVSEVYEIIDYCKILFAKRRIAMDSAIKRVGNNPTF